MRLTFVGHASVLAEHGPVGLLTDPWLEGDAFNDAWSPYPRPRLPPEGLDAVTHLWVSHEHPDHLSIPTLKAIAPERRAGIEVLYQQHWSPEVVRFLGGLGFAAVRELVHGRWECLGPGIEVVLHQVGHEDSALTVRAGGITVFDLNDAKPSRGVLRRMCDQIGPVDVLLNQFSIAGWPGNPDEPERLATASARPLAELERHVEVVQPRHVVPFASFVRFSHVENAFMNAAVTSVHDVVDRLGPERVVVLYPGDRWDPSETWDGTSAALARYRADHDRLADQPLRRHPPEDFDTILAAAGARVAELRRRYHRVLLRRIPAVTFVVTDLGRASSWSWAPAR